MASGIVQVGKLVTVDKTAGKYALTLNMNWNALAADVVALPNLNLPATSNGNFGFQDLFSFLKINQAASQGIGKIMQVAGFVAFFPQGNGGSPAPISPGGLYLQSDSGQVIALTENFNTASATPEPGQVDPGIVTFDLPFDTQSSNSSITITKLCDNNPTKGLGITGSAVLTFKTWKSDAWIR